MGGVFSGIQALGFIPIKGKINIHCIHSTHWGGWRQGDRPSNGWERPKPGGNLGFKV